MFIENRVNSGETVVPVPLGLDVVIQYNDRGIIQKVYRGFDKSVDISNDIMFVLTSNNTVPSSIRIKGGTTWVYGVLHTKSELPVTISGKLPNVNYDMYMKSYMKHPTDFKFYACNVDSFAVVFNGGDLKSRAWMTSEGFYVLPAYLMPLNATADTFEKMVKHDSYIFEWPLIMGLYVYSGGVMTYQSTELYQQKLCRIDTVFEEDGTIKDILYSDNDVKLYVNKTTTNRLGIGKKSVVVYSMDSPNEVIYNYTPMVEPQDNIACPTCGALIPMPQHGKITCSDENCPSLLYSRVIRMLGVLNLPTISKEKYDKYTKRKQVKLLDVFNFVEYEDVTVDVNIEDALRAVIPATILPGRNAYKIFVSKCNFSVDTVEYYIDHTEKFWEDLDLDKNVFYKLYTWLQVEAHREDVHSILHNSHVNIKDKSTSEIPLVLKDTLVYLTGTFECGTYEYVGELLSQYGATTTTDFSPSVSFVVIGDIPENIYGPAINSAKDRGILVFTESQFFQCFNIRRLELTEN